MERRAKFTVVLTLASLAIGGCARVYISEATAAAVAMGPSSRRGVAIFAGGCFWCMEKPFESQEGVIAVVSGYTGGKVSNPNYAEVSAGVTGHAEAVRIVYDRRTISYRRLLHIYWRNIDPFAEGRQFCDSGSQYRSAIFYLDGGQRRLALRSKLNVTKRFGRRVATAIVRAGTFYPAEEYHQDYYKRSPTRYRRYRNACGRDRRLRQIWGKKAGE